MLPIFQWSFQCSPPRSLRLAALGDEVFSHACFIRMSIILALFPISKSLCSSTLPKSALPPRSRFQGA